ncbi:MAG TPA: glycerol-3-phosphate 1-O-acyltransferase PlsY [Opitutaceae bacterium]|nr:glycerol-3-phosphate 1-O-acyltransferase PlsY [Opitutaceae bacterium]
MLLLPLLIALVVGYLFGSLPFGYLVARAKGVNIFEVGSKNPGATNVRRVLGSGPGNLVLLLDAAKGAAAAGWPLIFRWLALEKIRAAGNIVTSPDQMFIVDFVYPTAAIAGLVGAMLGHSFSCFTGFRGGKGVATGAGGFAVLFPLGALIAIAVFGLTLGVTRYASLGSMLGALSLPISAVLLQRPPMLAGLCVAVAIFVVVRHRANISRLLAGTENKSGRAAQKPNLT